MPQALEPPASRVYIKHFNAGDLVTGVFAVQNCQLGQTRSGKPFLKGLLSDRTGRTAMRMWNASAQLFEQLPADGFVHIEGQTQPYQGDLQIIVNKIRAHEPTAAELTQLLPTTEHDIDKMFAELVKLMTSLEHSAISALAQTYLADGELMERFCQAPAGMAMHHAYLGGLLEHTLSLLRAAEALLDNYPQLNRDIVLLGLFIHDLGKCQELVWQRGFNYSDDGRLVGHIARGCVMLDAKARQTAQDPEQPITVPTPILRVLEHIILSHHGEPQFGAAKMPSTPEAVFISHLDNLDAKMNIALAETRPTETDTQQMPAKDAKLGGHFTDKVFGLGNVRLYRPDPTTLDQTPETEK